MKRTRTGMDLLMAIALSCHVAAALPNPQGRINDFAKILDPATTLTLQRLVDDVERTTTAELAVVTVPSLEGQPVESYAHALFQSWGIGKQDKHNGVLFLVAPVERKMRIEVGYGLEPILPDGLCGHIIRQDCLPAFKRGQFAEGTRQGVQRLADLIRTGEPATAASYRSSRYGLPALWLTLFLSVFVSVGAWMAGAGLGSKTIAPLVWGGVFGGVPLGVFAYPELPLTHTAGLFLWAGILGAWGYRSASARPSGWRGRGRSARTSGWIAGGGSGRGSGGSSSGSGGGFGGGSSGGGGASGSW